ncbi:MAG: methyl-accepting chemotaxis protein [Candidatus Acidiferrales bacterium]
MKIAPTIGKKLYLGFGAVLTILVFLFVVSLSAILRERQEQSAAADALSGVQIIESARYQIMQNRLALSDYLLSGDTHERETVNQGISDLDELLRKGQSSTTDQDLASALERVERNEQDWADQFAKPLIDKRQQVDAGNSTVADLQVFYLEKDPATWVTRSSEILDSANDEIKKTLDDSSASATRTTTVTVVVDIVGVLLAIGLGMAIAFYTARSVTVPLDKMIAVACDISESGDLNQKIDLSRDDEIGSLARAFHDLVEYLKEISRVSAAIARGDLTVEGRPRSEHDTLAKAFSEMVQGLRSIVRQVRDGASQVAAGSEQVASASDESAKISVQTSSAIDEVTSTMHEMSVNVQNVVKNTQSQASSVAETSASIDQMVASITHVADTAKFLLDISQKSREEVQSGMTAMQKTTEGLNRTNKTIHTSSGIIVALGRRADDIGKIIEVIDDLAEQTNLLALNAAIEAARAGEHGLGFAVVADEVRKLAEKSAQSTKEISELIESIQKESREAVENMERSTAAVEEGLTMGTDLQSALGRISTVVTEVHKLAQEIGAATSEQSNGSSQIARATSRLTEITQEINSSVEEQASGAQVVVRAMEKMRELVQQSTSSSTELAAASEQMSKLARGLLESMDRFALEEGQGSALRGAKSERAQKGGERSRSSSHDYAELVRS